MKGYRALRRQILNRLLLDAFQQATNAERIRIIRELGKVNHLYPKRAKGGEHAARRVRSQISPSGLAGQ